MGRLYREAWEDMIMNTAQHLRDRLAGRDKLISMGAWDVLSAKVIASLGFDAVVLGSFNLHSAWGVPDVGLRTPSDLLEICFKTAGEVEIPVILDMEQGFGGTPQIAAYWAREFERAGAAAVHIDDKGPVQMCTWLPGAKEKIIAGSAEETAAKIEAMAAATENLVIIARCSLASGSDFDPEEETRRLHLYEEAGADLLYAPKQATLANDMSLLEKACREFRAGIFTQFNPPGYIRGYVPDGSSGGHSIADRSFAELFDAGVAMVSGAQLYPVAYRALLDTLEEVKREDSLRPAGPRMLPFDHVLDLVGYDRFEG